MTESGASRTRAMSRADDALRGSRRRDDLGERGHQLVALVGPGMHFLTKTEHLLLQLSGEVGLVDDTAGLAAADADEDASVQPVEVGRRGLDSGRRAEGVFGGVDVLAAGETF